MAYSVVDNKFFDGRLDVKYASPRRLRVRHGLV